MRAFLEAVRTADRSGLLSGPQESLATHRIVWLAEQARRSGSVVSIASEVVATGR